MQPKNQPSISQGKRANNLLRFSGLALQMGVTIALFAYLGKWLDGYFAFELPYLTAALALLAIFGSLYILILDLTKNQP